MSASPYIVDVTPENFAQVVQASRRAPVLMDFWADWCQPCKQLMPLLAKLADEYQGRFFLAKVNTEETQELAAQLGIRSIPTCKLFVNGQPVDEFSGALPEQAIRDFLDKHLPRPSDGLVAQAQQALATGDAAGALALLEQAKVEDPDNTRIDIAIAQTKAANGDPEGALAVLDVLPAEKQLDSEVQALRSQIEFESQAADMPDASALMARLETNPDDSEARVQLANHHVLTRNYEAALELLLEQMRRDRNYDDDVARRTMIKIFDLLGDDPLASRYRGKMFTLMH